MIITFAHTKGGVGKSLLAWNLAVPLRARIIDLDFQKTLLFVNSIREQNGRKPIRIDQADELNEFFALCGEVDEDENIIIDVGGFDSELTRMALYTADLIITPAADRLTEMAGLLKFHDILKEVSENVGVELKAHVLINNVNPNAKDFDIVKTFVDDSEHFAMMNTIIHQRADFYRSMEEGATVYEIGKGKAYKEIKKLIKEIKSKLKK